MILFWGYKFVFIAYHFETYSSFTFKELLNVFVFGTRLDLSFAAYLSIVPLVFLIISSIFYKFPLLSFIKGYTSGIIILLAITHIVDLEIFKTWGFRIDTTLIKYLTTPKEAIASAGAAPVLLLTVLLIISIVFSYTIFKAIVIRPYFELRQRSNVAFLTLLLIGGVLILPIRGGLQLAPINQSSVYFSNDQYLNQAAINAPWNFSYSIIENNHNEENPFIYQSVEEVQQRMDVLYPTQDSASLSVIKNKRPNIILIIWESFTAKTVEKLGGRKGITPNFNSIIKEGIFFDNFYASGDRSDKGLIAILSSFPAQSTTSIMRKTNKAAKLPSLAKSLKANDYSSYFYYGGEPEFANIKSYLINSKYDQLITKDYFPPESWNSKWGAHDEVVFDKLLSDAHESRQPFFSTLFTLSSHEPFEIPMKPLLKGKDEETLFLNSIHYTDSCLGAFIDKAKKELWWDNTLIIITADHGHRLPGGMVNHYPDEFKIPMLWVGGALAKKDTIISVISSQTDIASTLLNQLNINSEEFNYSKNLLSTPGNIFAYYAFKNGFGYITESGKLVFDNVSKNALLKDSSITEEDVRNGKAYLQYSFQDYLNK
jgi:phosphoglycerol transferase MdoB-like AlkP superfamily enzyme